MKRTLLLSLLVLSVGAACKRGEPEHDEHEDAHAGEEKAEAHGHDPRPATAEELLQ